MKNDDSIEKEILENRGKSNVEDDNIKMIKPKLKKKKNYLNKVDKIKTKNFSNRRFILSLTCVVIISLAFVIGGSFASTTTTKEGKGTSKLEAGTMKLKFDNENESITLDNALPQTKNDALANNREYIFNINNIGNVGASYVLSLDNICKENNKYTVNNKEVRADLCIPNEYIKVGLSINEAPYNVLTYNSSTSGYVIDNGILDINMSNRYKLKVWLSLDTPNTYNQKGSNVVYAGKLKLSYNQIDPSTQNNSSQLDNANQSINNTNNENISQLGE